MAGGVSQVTEAERFTTTDISVEMDPRLQCIVAQRSRGIMTAASASGGVDEVPVIALVSDADSWAATSEVRASVTISGPDPHDKTYIVTGLIPATRIEAVRVLPIVKSLKAARPIRPALAAGIEETRADLGTLPPQTLSNGGKGVVVGVVDYGCDVAHRNFLTGAGRTRLRSIWHQGGAASPHSPFTYGREITPDEINAVLTLPDPYGALRYEPPRDTPWSRGTHGTHVLDICAGSGGGSGVQGFAPNADLIFVDVLHDDIPFDGPKVVDSSFGDSKQLLDAVRYIFDKAGSQPCVVNISLGTNGGPHDGSTLVEQGIDRMLKESPNRAVTIAASNSYADGIHAKGKFVQDGVTDLAWLIPQGDQSINEFELWYSGVDRVSVELIDPTGASLGTILPGGNGTVLKNGNIDVFVANRLEDPSNGCNTIGIYLASAVKSGKWTVRLRGDAITDGAFHAWIERDNLTQSSFAPPHDNSCTIGSISCGHLAIAVGSYDAHKTERPISFFSSAGPTRDGRKKPEISGPGHGVFAAHSRTRTGVTNKSGTSMAAPAVAGIIALALGEARARGHNLTVEEIRQIVIDSARHSPPPGGGWDDRYGHGRIDASTILADVIRRAQQSQPAVASATRRPARRSTAARSTMKPSNRDA